MKSAYFCPMKKQQRLITQDGSHTLFNEKSGEHYHSVFGAVQESEHIFIGAGLEKVAGLSPIRILEIGMGTGLNALLTLKWAAGNNKKVQYLGLEPYPLPVSVLKGLNYPRITGIAEASFLTLHKPGEKHEVTPFFEMEVVVKTIQRFSPESNTYHVVFFDAFSPESQPEMWTGEVFRKLYRALVSGGVLVTYSCKGDVKRALKAAGFVLEKLPGPPGKREFLRATVLK